MILAKIADCFSGFKMTVISAVFLAISLYMMIQGIELKSTQINPAIVTVIISGYPLIYEAFHSLFCEKRITSALLISIAIFASLIIGELFAAAEVSFIMAIGEILEDKTVARAKKGLAKLMELAPVQGRKLTRKGDSIIEEIVTVDKISIGDTLRVLPGETIPVDGNIIVGTTSVDQSVMTGESLPVDKSIGDDVFCGTLNCFGSIDITATKVGADSSLQKLINMVKEAEGKQAPMQRTADKWAQWLVPISLCTAIITFIVNYLLGIEFMQALDRGVTVLVVFCPCALALATPTSIMAAIGQATKFGIVVKSGEALEKMGKVDTVAFDKTGTLTFGKLTVSDVISFLPKLTKNELLDFAASAESRSEHPLGKALLSHAQKEHCTTKINDVVDFKMKAGKGIEALIDNKKILCGNEKYLNENKIFADDKIRDILRKLRTEGKALILIAIDDEFAGVVALSDELRPTAQSMVSKLQNMDTDVVLLTGDHKQTATYFAHQVGIKDDNIHGELLPEDKMNTIDRLQQQHKKVCMIGDGVNDAPALKIASVGIAMGSMGSDIAVDAADIALMNDDISKIPYLKKLSRSTLSTIKGNITAAMTINLIAVILSVIGVLNPITGALVHNIGSVLVILNAALLYDRKFSV